MYYLKGDNIKEGLKYISEAAEVALEAQGEKARCGSIIVKDGEIIGKGFNSPSAGSDLKCEFKKEDFHKRVTDKTCCVHAEQRAIMDALSENPEKLTGARLYFVRVDDEGYPEYSGKPYCTICSKMSLDVGISEFVLYHKEGIGVYETGEYNDLSYKYND